MIIQIRPADTDELKQTYAITNIWILNNLLIYFILIWSHGFFLQVLLKRFNLSSGITKYNFNQYHVLLMLDVPLPAS